MYFPKSQIQTNLYSNGDLTVLQTGQTYTGWYWGTSNGKFFAGKTPDSPQSYIELVKSSKNTVLFTQAEPPAEDEATLSYIDSNINSLAYVKLRNLDLNDPFPYTPKYIPAKPTKENYLTGEFLRYFCKKINESLFIEISPTDYDKLIKKDKSIFYQLYTPFKLNWALSGDLKNISRENQNAVELLETNQNLYGLGAYLRYNYLQFVDQTPGVQQTNVGRIYKDTGNNIPSNLPQAYQLGNQNNSKGQNCLNCIFYQQGLCRKWNAPIRNEYWCSAWKYDPNTLYDDSSRVSSLPKQKELPKSNIYTKQSNNGNTPSGY